MSSIIVVPLLQEMLGLYAYIYIYKLFSFPLYLSDECHHIRLLYYVLVSHHILNPLLVIILRWINKGIKF